MPSKNKGRVSKSVKKYVERAIKQEGEIKRFPKVYASASITQSWNVNGSFFQVPQGDDNSERIGTEVQGIGLDVRGLLSLPTAKDHAVLRMLVYIPNDSSIQSSDLPADIYTPPNADFMTNVKVLLDKVFVLNSTSEKAGTTNQIKYFREWIPFRRVVRYRSSTTTDPNTAHPRIAFVSSEATNTPVVQYNTSFLYRDK